MSFGSRPTAQELSELRYPLVLALVADSLNPTSNTKLGVGRSSCTRQRSRDSKAENEGGSRTFTVQDDEGSRRRSQEGGGEDENGENNDEAQESHFADRWGLGFRTRGINPGEQQETRMRPSRARTRSVMCGCFYLAP